VRQLLRKQTNT